MKPIQQQKDPRITSISFDNFTGSVCIITPLSDDDDDDDEDLMLSSPHTNGGGDLFIPSHHLTLLTQPVLAGRSRRKNPLDSLINGGRNSFNESPALILPIHRINKAHCEKRNSQQESSDSGIDLSLSTNSSVQYSQQRHELAYRPLSTLNEDSNTDQISHDQPNRFPGSKRSMEHIHHEQHRSTSTADEREKLTQGNSTHLDTLTAIPQSINTTKTDVLHPPVQQYRSLNDLTNKSSLSTHTILRKANLSTLKPLRKKSKLNILLEPSMLLASTSSYLPVNHEHLPSVSRTTSSSSNQTIAHSLKVKAMTPLGHYPNPDQIRAHTNRSLLEKQHPIHLPAPARKGILQQLIPFDASPSKVNRQHKQPAIAFHSCAPPARLSKPTLPILNNEETVDGHRKEHNRNRIRDAHQPMKTNQSSEQVLVQSQFPTSHHKQQEKRISEHFLTSTPRQLNEHDNDHADNRRRRQFHNHLCRNTTDNQFKQAQSNTSILKGQHPMESKAMGLAVQNDNPSSYQNIEFDSEHRRHNSMAPFHSRPKKLVRLAHISSQNEQKSSTESINNLLQTTRIQPLNSTSIRRERDIHQSINLSKLPSTSTNFTEPIQGRSSTYWLTIPDHQQQYDVRVLSPSLCSPCEELINDKSPKTAHMLMTDEQQLVDGRYVIPQNNSAHPSFVDPPSQTSSRHTYPFTCTPDSDHGNDVEVKNSSRRLRATDQRSSISSPSSSLDRFSPHDRFPLPLGKTTISMEKDDLSTNYDSDDGWSNDSAEVIYTDQRYDTQKKKKNHSSSHLISKQQTHQ